MIELTLIFAPVPSLHNNHRMGNNALLQLDLPGITKVKSGKVRDIFDLGERLLFVATDRISAFDCIMPNGIPRKGRSADPNLVFLVQPNRVLPTQPPGVPRRRSAPAKPAALCRRAGGRSMIVKKATPLAIECVVRGYLAGSGWKEYRQSQTVCGIKLPAGLEGILRIARADFHAGDQGRDRPRRKHFLRTGGPDRGRGHR